MAIFDKGDKMAKETSTTIISQGANLQGNFDLSAKLHIEGKMEGKINSSNQISVGKSGVLKGEVVCEKFILNGNFEGKIECNVLEITNGGVLKGDIVIKDLIIEKGGIFEGTSTLKKKDASKNS
ncbi:MAG: polymer-forming cytoskeletal family protein [Nautilia sp.]|nr:MAG: polymer-forming cytoskeletal family protein [Nautilia sp.]